MRRLRNRGIAPISASGLNDQGDVQALMIYVAERLPIETKPARTVMWTLSGEGLGNVETVFEDELPAFIKKLTEEAAHSITISAPRPKNVR